MEKELIDINEAHRYLLYLLKVVENICEKNGITYYAIGGTLLGAVRHQGFIPWDDDIDIGIDRRDYEKFVSACYKELKYPVVIRCRENDKYYCQEFVKICFKDANDKYTDLSLDVFFFDKVDPQKKIKVALQNSIKNNLYAIKLFKVSKDGMGDYVPRHPLKKAFLSIASLVSYDAIDKFLYFVMTCGKSEQFVTNWGSYYPRYKEIYDREWLGTSKTVKFEDMFISIPEKPEKILLQVFGDDYMEVPPPGKRVAHNTHKFSGVNLEELDINS